MGVLFYILGIAALGAVIYSITRKANQEETEREDKWAAYEGRSRKQ